MLGDLDGVDEFIAALDPPSGERTERLQAYIFSGSESIAMIPKSALWPLMM